jgi:hypothetical protein
MHHAHPGVIMRRLGKNMPAAAVLLWLSFLLVFSCGCQWAKSKVKDPAHAAGSDYPSHTGGDTDISYQQCRQLMDENQRLREDLKTKELDVTKLTADLTYCSERNKHLEQLCESIRQDLTQAEKQFISIEERLQLKETKASAVSALAEAKLAYDKYKVNLDTNSDLESLKEIEQKLEESSQLIQKENYAASVYYSKRVHKMLERSANTQVFLRSHVETRIVSVQKANLRSGPGLDHDVIAQLTFGAVLVQVEKSDEWSRIETQDGIEGWIHRNLIH